MAGEKAKENRTLHATCVACGKDLSVELLRGITVGTGRDRRIVAVCQPCLDGGWSTDSLQEVASAEGATEASAVAPSPPDPQ